MATQMSEPPDLEDDRDRREGSGGCQSRGGRNHSMSESFVAVGETCTGGRGSGGQVSAPGLSAGLSRTSASKSVGVGPRGSQDSTTEGDAIQASLRQGLREKLELLNAPVITHHFNKKVSSLQSCLNTVIEMCHQISF